MPEPGSNAGSGMRLPDLHLLFQDNHCLVVDKPAGLATEAPPTVADTLANRARQHLREAGNKQGRVYLGIPHRLDRPTSGVLLFARSSKAAARLAEQFRERQVSKSYWAITAGVPTSDEFVLRHWLRKVEGEARAEVVPADSAGAQLAEMSCRLLQRLADNLSLIECHPRTGRFHQIRVQLAAEGLPVIGDALYGGRPMTGLDESAIALHARSLTFLHPIKYEPVTVTAPLPKTWVTYNILAASTVPAAD